MRPGGETQSTLDALIAPLVRQAQAFAQQAATEDADIAYAPPDEPPPRDPGPADTPPAEGPPKPPAGDEPDKEPPEDEEPPDQEPEPNEEDEEERRRRCAALREELAQKREALEQAKKDLALVQLQPFTEVPRDKVQDQLDLLAEHGQLAPDTERGPPVEVDPEDAEDKDPASDRNARALYRTWRNLKGYLVMTYNLTFGRYKQIMEARVRALEKLRADRDGIEAEVATLDSILKHKCDPI